MQGPNFPNTAQDLLAFFEPFLCLTETAHSLGRRIREASNIRDPTYEISGFFGSLDLLNFGPIRSHSPFYGTLGPDVFSGSSIVPRENCRWWGTPRCIEFLFLF
ncbi:hypothetical protein Pdw03_8714 [Penicillium digitatum]|uniref:Uncharacterized protein n=1 Tax=Penicillium digitatum TaxID=36651 RepID=A0A7T6XP57_PENDI|nr:hypothetical protein Pdw03_8714 [Penicillium digitatum]